MGGEDSVMVFKRRGPRLTGQGTKEGCDEGEGSIGACSSVTNYPPVTGLMQQPAYLSQHPEGQEFGSAQLGSSSAPCGTTR